MRFDAPVYSLIDATSRSPPVVGFGKEPLSDVAAAVSVPPAYCTNAGGVAEVPGTVRLNEVLWVADAPAPVTVMGYVPTGVVVDVVTVMVDVPVPAVSVCGAKDTRAPVGAPVADRATDWATPLVTAVEMVDVAVDPATAVPEPGEALMEKSSVGGGEPEAALKSARPAVQYMLLGNVPVKVSDVRELSARVPTTTEVVVPEFCWAWLVKPGAVTVMDWELACPATNPTARSLELEGVTPTVAAVVPVPEVADEPSTGSVVATPENSWAEREMVAADAVCTVTAVVGSASAEYQSAPSERWPVE
jgi:hypothetical protein